MTPDDTVGDICYQRLPPAIDHQLGQQILKAKAAIDHILGQLLHQQAKLALDNLPNQKIQPAKTAIDHI